MSKDSHSEIPIESESKGYISKHHLDTETAKLLTSILDQHLSCFLLLGYDYKGDGVSVQLCKTQKDIDSLQSLVNRHVNNYILDEDYT